MKLFLVKYKKSIEYEGDEISFYVVAAEDKWTAMKEVASVYNLGECYLNAEGPVPNAIVKENIKETTILLSY